MAAKNEAKVKLSADVSGFNSEIKKAGSAITELRSELKLNSEEMKTNGVNADGLSDQLRILNDISGEYDRKISALTSKMQATAEVYGENSDECRKLQTQINNTAAAQQRILQQINSTTAQLNEMGAELSGASGEMADMRTATEKLSDSIKKQESDLDALKDSYKNVVLEQGKNSDEAKSLAKDIQSLSAELKENKNRLDDAEASADKFDKSIEDAGDAAQQAEGGFTILGGAVSAFIGNILAEGVSKIGDFATSIFELSEATEEYRAMMAKVSGSADSFGYSIDDAKTRYQDFYRYLGDDQMATNAITNLMGMRVNTETLDSVINGAIATWTAYGDSIPIESLTESITETVNVSKVTGTFADTINWATLSSEQWNSVLGEGSEAQKAFNASLAEGEAVEDAFSAALAATSDQQDRANLVAALLNTTYGQSKATYDSLSGSILDANAAEAELKETQAELGETLTPLNAKMTQLKNKALKSMAPMVKDVADSFSDMIDDIDWDGAADKIGDVADVAMDGLKWLSKNIKPVTTLVVSLGAAWLTYKGIMAGANAATMICETAMTVKSIATGAATVALGTHTTATVAATTAQEALNLAQLACPIALITAGVVAAGVAIYGLVQHQKSMIEEQYGLNDAQKANIETVNEMHTAYEEMDTARQESMDSVAAEYGHLESLKDELVSLVDANGQIKEGEEDRANFIISTLSSALGVEEQDIRDIIAANGDLSASLDEVIEKKKAEAILSANEEAYKEAVQNKAEALSVYNQALADAEEAERNYKAVMQENADVMETYQNILENAGYEAAESYMGLHQGVANAVRTSKEAYEEATAAVSEAEETYVGYCSTIENYEGASAAILSGDADAISATMERLQNEFITAEQGTRETLQQQVADCEQAYADMQTAIQQGAPGVTQEAVAQAQDMVARAQAELDKFELSAPETGKNAVNGYNAAISSGSMAAGKAAITVRTSTESGLASTNSGAIGANTVNTYNTSVRGQSGNARTAAAVVAEAARQGLNSADTKSVGVNFGLGFIIGQKSVDVETPAKNLAKRALGAMKKALGIQSPSTEAYEAGDYFWQGFRNAVNDGAGAVEESVTNLAEGALGALYGTEKSWNPAIEPFASDASLTLSDHVSSAMSHLLESGMIDYDRMEEAMTRAARNADIKMVANNRELARTRLAIR